MARRDREDRDDLAYGGWSRRRADGGGTPWVGAGAAGAELATLADQERLAIERALALHDGNRRRAAKHLGMGLRTLYDRLKRYGWT